MAHVHNMSILLASRVSNKEDLRDHQAEDNGAHIADMIDFLNPKFQGELLAAWRDVRRQWRKIKEPPQLVNARPRNA